MAPPAPASSDFVFRPLRKPEEYRHAEELQREGLGPDAALAVPAAILRAVQDNGGLALGAFADIYLAGCTVATIGWDGTTLYQHVHATVVRAEYRNHHVGFRLKAYLRDEVLRLGLGEARWAFDPLHRPSASLSIRQLGARPDALLPNYFGQVSEPGGPRDETDRLHVRWPLADPEVERRMAGERPTADDDRRRQAAAHPIIETEPSETGLRVPTSVDEPEGPAAHLEIPFDIATVRAHEPDASRRWRHAVRDAFRAAFDLGYVVEDFVGVPIAHERRSFYLLRPGPREGAAPVPGRR